MPVLLVATVLPLAFASISYVAITVLEKEPTNPKNLLLWLLVRFYVWAALSPAVVVVSRKFPVKGTVRGRFIAAHFTASVLFSLTHIAIYLPVFLLVDWPGSKTYVGSPRSAIAIGLNSIFPLGIFVYWVILGVITALDLYRQYGQERVRAADLEKQLVESQLNALKMQLQPHFLFNTLHSLTDIVLEDPKEATRMIARLGDFLRLTLDNSGSQLVGLKTELEFLRSYLEIERIRFQDRLKLQIDVDPRTEQMLVPNLILQPLVENAIRHGIARRIGSGTLDVKTRQVNHHLEIEIKDDGPGLAADVLSGRQGVGLANVRKRLDCLYGHEAALLLENGERGGLIATLRLPASCNGDAQLPAANDRGEPL
ncbi:MAG TPA: histidine kinase [Blastocatellia bacterium]